MLQSYIDVFKSNKGQCYNTLLTILDKIKVNVTILYWSFELKLIECYNTVLIFLIKIKVNVAVLYWSFQIT